MFNAEEMAHKFSEFWALVDVTSAHFGHWLTSVMPHCSHSLPTFAANAKSNFKRTYSLRTFPTFTFCHVADAAFVCSCGGTLLAAQGISPERPLRRSKLGIHKPHFRCARAQQSSRGWSGWRLHPTVTQCGIVQMFSSARNGAPQGSYNNRIRSWQGRFPSSRHHR